MQPTPRLDRALHEVRRQTAGAAPAVQLTAWQRFADQHPDAPEGWLQWAEAARACGRVPLAVEVLGQALVHHPHLAVAWANRGVLLSESKRVAEGEHHLKRALELDPDYGYAWAQLAYLQESLDRGPEAEQSGIRARQLRPDDAAIGILLARLAHHAGRLVEAKEALEGLLERPLAPRLAGSAGLELARVLDRLKDPGAWPVAARAQAVRRGLPEVAGIDRDWVCRTAQLAREGWPPAVNRVVPPMEGPPIFVVGFPRSGTTLVERILGSTGLPGTDEARFFDQVRVRVGQKVGHPDGAPPALVDRLTDDTLQAVRQLYLELGQAELGGPRWIDKYPMNVLHLPWIRRLFPESPIVLVLRDPRDVVVSGFFQDMVLNRAMVHFLELGDLARAYVDTMSLWRDWRGDPALNVFELRYETLVDDFEPTARALLAHCGLPWTDAVLAFHRSETRVIRAPSYHAVSEPINPRARGKWRRYEAELAPILPRLQPLVDAFGYGQPPGGR